MAQLIGAVPTWQSTVRTDGFGRATNDGTRTRGYRFEVNPSQLQRLGRGEACIARLDRDRAARAARGSRSCRRGSGSAAGARAMRSVKEATRPGQKERHG